MCEKVGIHDTTNPTDAYDYSQNSNYLKAYQEYAGRNNITLVEAVYKKFRQDQHIN